MGLIDLISERAAVVAVIGLGYVGLPLARAASVAGFRVIGIDSDPERVRLLQDSDQEGIELTSDPQHVGDADIIVICVPTPLKDGAPDMSYVEGAAQMVAKGMKKGCLVILESTTYPGTTEELLFGILESSGLKAGYDFLLGFSPERIDPGNETFGLTNVPKIVGGLNQESTAAMSAFYGAFVQDVVEVTSPRTAEMAKLLENTYRHVNIALVNEIAILCHDLGIDVWEVIAAASTKPFGFEPFYPGPGWGGHCIPVDPTYLSWRVRQMGATARFVELAREFNEKMPAYIVQRTEEALQEEGKGLRGAAIIVLGVTYKPDVPDTRESPSLEIIDRLMKQGADVRYNDPLIPRLQVRSKELHSIPIAKETLSSCDLVLLLTHHSSYDPGLIAAASPLVFDTRNYLRGQQGRVIIL